MTAQPAVGSIETKGFPGILAAADAMVKVKTAMAAGIEAVNKTEGAALETWVIIPRPHDNVVAILPIDYSEAVEPFRAAADGAIAPIRR